MKMEYLYKRVDYLTDVVQKIIVSMENPTNVDKKEVLQLKDSVDTRVKETCSDSDSTTIAEDSEQSAVY